MEVSISASVWTERAWLRGYPLQSEKTSIRASLKRLYLGVNTQAKRASISNSHNVGFQVNSVTASLTPSADRLGVRAVFLDDRLSEQLGITIYPLQTAIFLTV